MLASVGRLLSKIISPLWQRIEVDEETLLYSTTDAELIRHLRRSAVTQLCLDYGLIDDAIYFTRGEVLGGVPLKEGDLVDCTAVRGDSEGGWKALRVEKCADDWEDGGRTSLEAEKLHPIIGTVTSFDGDSGFINDATIFPRSSLLYGYEPMKGDWVQAKYFVDQTQWKTQAQFVAPLRYCRLEKMCVTSVHNKIGVVEDTVFFNLDTLLLPDQYQPLPGHLVNLVVVETSQSLFSWRALCLAPCSASGSTDCLPEADGHLILENKEGLTVTDYGQFGSLMIGEKRQLVFWIQNEGSVSRRLKCCDFADWDSEKQFTLLRAHESTPTAQRRQPSRENGPGSSGKRLADEKEPIRSAGVRREEREVDISPGERISIVVACIAKSLGSCAELLLLHFPSFTIGRRLEVTVCSEEENLLQPSSSYCPYDLHPVAAVPDHVIALAAPKMLPRLARRALPSFLPHYPVPQALRDCVEAHCDVLVFQPLLGEVLSPFNMHSRFSTLLWLEELHAERELREVAIDGAFLRKGAGYLLLEVPGLTEGRPSVNIGDRIVLKKQQHAGVVMECVAYVMEISDNDLSLKVNSDFHRSYLGEPLDVCFTLNRLTSRRCHKALKLTEAFGDILFPTKVTRQSPQWTGKWVEEAERNTGMDQNEENGKMLSSAVDVESKATQTKDGGLPPNPGPRVGHFFNPDLNPSQREAVKRILAGESRPTPYVLFGPPGTGKTITLIEAVLQVYHFIPSSRLLLCTPSNSAADLICIRLHHSGFLDAASMARVNATCRQEQFIPEVLRQYSKSGEDVHQASFHRIVVSTCSSAGMFHNIGLPLGHFTHVFLDEAGQATEPESLIPISFISERDGQIMLAGDPCQLGPLIKSKVAVAFGFGVSFLERLMASPLYSRHDWGYNPNVVTKLVYNYRSHEALLKVPSKLFYRDELCFKAPRDIIESLCQWKTLPTKGFPLLFHGVRGKEMREGSNPSWFNPVEAVQAMLYCCQLAKRFYNPVAPSDIGIIAPYRKQCEKIRILLAKVGLSDIKVGSVEEFQGQEFLVIIMSTVRSNESVESDDLQSGLGFLSNPKRFNVAITRSKALLLIVGNPHVLIGDPCFRALLQYCCINGGYLGCDPPPSLRVQSGKGGGGDVDGLPLPTLS
ncbi:RNA helicase Mov10l1 [Brachionichthys hirsutus]|uniref:RNA helicase Mov10l1 n=1 Tax=Brachionichthys hirsutus TaxID=412623 RepID=UPI00360468A9